MWSAERASHDSLFSAEVKQRIDQIMQICDGTGVDEAYRRGGRRVTLFRQPHITICLTVTLLCWPRLLSSRDQRLIVGGCCRYQAYSLRGAVVVGVVAGVEVMTTAAGVEYEARSKRNLQLRDLRPFCFRSASMGGGADVLSTVTAICVYRYRLHCC